MFYFVMWILISTFLLGFWFWTTYVLYKQKSAWKKYAEKRKLRYVAGGFYDSPGIEGVVDDYTVAIFTADHSHLDERSQRKLSSVELALKSAVPVSTYLATGRMVGILKQMLLPQEYRPEHMGWDDSYAICSTEQAVAEAYFTPERLDAILSLTKIKNLWVVVLFFDGRGLLRIDLPDPVVDERRLDILMKKLIEVAGVLELKKGEDLTIMQKVRDIKSGQGKIKIADETELSQLTGLTLELEDEEHEAKPKKTTSKKKKLSDEDQSASE